MQCVGTLCWSIPGLAPGTRPRAVRPPAVRQLLRRVSSKAQAPAAARAERLAPSAHRSRDLRDAGAEQKLFRSESASAMAVEPTSRATRAEVRPLEQDWSQIVRRCMDGDSGAWAEMVRTHHKRVYGLCYRFTGNAADAEDLTQDVFLKIYSNLSSFDAARGSLPVWITTMTRNLLVDNFRRTRNQRATNSLDDGWETGEDLRPADRLVAAGPNPHESAARKELANMVQGALARVSVELREAVILRDLQDLDYKDIAQVLGIPEGTVKSRISRGRAELARLLERNKQEVM
jgi:RNA polymerase sigma-70 factor (ECF subfamily)